MAVKAILVLCASAVLVKTISAQCLGNIGYGNGLGLSGNQVLAAENIGYGAGYSTGLVSSELAYGAGLGSYGLGGVGGVGACNFGALPVTISCPIAPNGISVVSENVIEGVLLASGALPFLAGVAFEGELASGGQTSVSAGCGSGNVGIVSEGLAGAAGVGYGAGLAGNALAGGLGYGAGLANGGLAGGISYGAGLANGSLSGGIGYGAGLANGGLAGGIGYGAGLANGGLSGGIGYGAGLANGGLAGGIGGIRRPGGCGCGAAY